MLDISDIEQSLKITLSILLILSAISRFMLTKKKQAFYISWIEYNALQQKKGTRKCAFCDPAGITIYAQNRLIINQLYF